MDPSHLPAAKNGTWLRIGLLALMTCLAAAVFWNLGSGRRDFYNELWAPAHLLVQGKNAYDTSSLGTELPPLWLPPALGVFTPLGWLPEEAAGRVWLLLSLAALALTVSLSLRRESSFSSLLLAALLAFFFPPVVNHLALGQFSILASLCCLLAARCAVQSRPWPEAFLLSLALGKPQLAFLAAAGLGFYHFRQEGLPGAARFGLRVGVAALMLSLPVILLSRGWLASLAAGFAVNPAWPHPSLFTFIQVLAGAWAWALWGLVAAAGVYACWRLWHVLPPLEAMAWTLALTPVLAPYIGSWDFVLLLPAWVLVFSRADAKRQVFLLLAYLAGWAGMAAVQLSADFSNWRFWWVPLWSLGVLGAVEASKRGIGKT